MEVYKNGSIYVLKGQKAPSLTDIRFEVVVAMMNADEKLYKRVKAYLG